MTNKKGGGGAAVAIVGCLVVLLLLVLLGGAGAAVYVFTSGSGGVLSPKGERIEYGPVSDSARGPSRVEPSGRSARTLKTKAGVIGDGADEVELRSAVRYPSSKGCDGPERVTDLVKGVVFDVDRQMRKQSPLSAREEMELGDELARQVAAHPQFKGKVDTPQTKVWRAYLARVAQPLLAEIKRKDITYKFHVIDSPVVNAFAIPGGHIYFFTGLLENRGATWLANEAQLAGILAHEISHVDLGHCAAVYQYLKQLGLSGKGGQKAATIVVALARHAFSSNQEDEADANATRLMTLAQYAPTEFIAMWRAWHKAQAKGKRDKRQVSLEDNPLGRELVNLLKTHSTPRERTCNAIRNTKAELEKSRFDRFYVGKTNYRRKKARTERQY